MNFLNLRVLFPWGQSQRLKTHPSAMEELTQYLVVMQTHRLNTNDQSFKADNEQVAEKNGDPKTQVRFLTGQGKDGQTQPTMRHGKRSHTHERKGIAEHTDDGFEEIHEGLDEEHQESAHPASFNRPVTFHPIPEAPESITSMPKMIAKRLHGSGREAIATATFGAIAVLPRNDPSSARNEI